MPSRRLGRPWPPWRMLVRDLIAQRGAEILEHLPAWLATEGCSLGIGTPVVIADTVALIAKWV
ncbi:hypothetical protein [Gandjariella thermophila]|nr:hypothetical protein [Gandjariella thermophila]